MEAVETTRGTVECKHFVNCAGFWARNVGKLSEPYVKVSSQRHILWRKFGGTRAKSNKILLLPFRCHFIRWNIITYTLILLLI